MASTTTNDPEASALEQMKVMTNIDRRKCHRVVPLEVLCLGLSRTGTLSLREALRTLGYNDTYQYSSCSLENPRDCEMWTAAFRAKFQSFGKPFTRTEWDQLLGHCMAVTDSPAVFFFQELMSAFPNAQIILTTRDLESYYASFMATLWPFGVRFSVPTTNPFRKLYRWLMPRTPFAEMNNLLYRYGHGNDFPVTGKQRYLRHNDQVREFCRSQKRELLEFDVRQGWGPLCRFLNREIPDTNFPRLHKTDSFNRKWEPAIRLLEGTVYLKMFALMAGLVGVGSWVVLRVW